MIVSVLVSSAVVFVFILWMCYSRIMIDLHVRYGASAPDVREYLKMMISSDEELKDLTAKLRAMGGDACRDGLGCSRLVCLCPLDATQKVVRAHLLEVESVIESRRMKRTKKNIRNIFKR